MCSSDLTQGRLQDIHIKPDVNPPIFVSGPVESIATVGLVSYRHECIIYISFSQQTAHPSKVLNDALLAKVFSILLILDS